MELNIPIKKGTNSRAILTLLNPFLSHLTETEITIVSNMIDMDIDTLNRYNRANLRDKMRMGKYTFNNYIQSLKTKGVIIQTIGDLIINPKIKTLTDTKVFTISFVEN